LSLSRRTGAPRRSIQGRDETAGLPSLKGFTEKAKGIVLMILNWGLRGGALAPEPGGGNMIVSPAQGSKRRKK